ncbi:MAG: hypothetical protein M3530_12585 [Thermoproteota archaeon]|nr:hypothetical protein [Thermoproteota archaeon]
MAGIIVTGSEDGIQHTIGNLFNFLVELPKTGMPIIDNKETGEMMNPILEQ